MSYEVNVLVNGNKCRQYHHDGKLFIEAKHGSEYSIEIKNNTWQRILSVCSVDGLDVLNGKTATVNAPGYVINGYGSLKIDGFRVSNNQVAKFLFGQKENSYAASKEDGSEKNVGVIGVRLFTEKVQPPPVVVREEHHIHHHPRPGLWNPWTYDNTTTIWNDGGTFCGSTSNTKTATTLGGSDECLYDKDLTTKGNTVRTRGVGGATKGAPYGQSFGLGAPYGQSFGLCAGMNSLAENVCNNSQPLGFDVGTKFGEAKESKVVEVEFEKGVLALTTNIYYASRQSLIEMGVPIGNEKQVAFPEPFKDGKYATPPKNWNS